ncbi:DnaT-like ssDNA-binding protein [Oricola thermophila]|uniref:Putative DnaT-like domain-containing protein n=1 Tax=Oricola thermophila TaxID=2742145 RepID=A0A6N1VA76_9HYPH|nr:DnaT-like ssDNA-binding protein [Oricola thermophila]QKV17850.1 hypothetical protein HTY61_04940 [Oricola thermophila]
MALIVEDGSIVAGADCYADVAAFDAWDTDFYGTASTATTADKEAAIRRAVVYLDSLSWKGRRLEGRSQPRAWPREGVADGEGNIIPTDEVPAEVIFAQHRLARAELTSPGALDAEFKASDAVKREKVGQIEVEYVRGASVADDARTIVAMAMDEIQGLLTGGDVTGGGTSWVLRA